MEVERKTLLRSEAARSLRSAQYGQPHLYQPVSAKLLTAFFGILAVGLITWLYWATFKTTAVVRGSLVPESGLVKIYPSHRGTYREIRAREGQKVTRGEILAIIADEQRDESGDEYYVRTLNALKLERDKLSETYELNKALHAAAMAELTDAHREAVSELAFLEEQIPYEQKALQIDEQDLQINEDLLKKEFVPLERVLPKRSTVVNGQKHQVELRKQRETLRFTIKQRQHALVQQPLQFQDKQLALELRISELDRRMADTEVAASMLVTAPVDGTVTAVTARRSDPVTESPLLSIVPLNSTLQVELYVTQAALGGVQTGQEVFIEFDAYPLEKYGNYRAVVTSISNASVDPREHLLPVTDLNAPVYLVHAKLDRQHAGGDETPLPLQSGMQFTADVVTEDRSILANIFTPITNIQKRL